MRTTGRIFVRLFAKNKDSALDDPIAKILVELHTANPDSEEYSIMVAHLERLIRLKVEVKRRVSPDTMALVMGNIVGILIIVAYEQKHVMVSKGLGFVGRARSLYST
jgi:hypothetical protein